MNSLFVCASDKNAWNLLLLKILRFVILGEILPKLLLLSLLVMMMLLLLLPPLLILLLPISLLYVILMF